MVLIFQSDYSPATGENSRPAPHCRFSGCKVNKHLGTESKNNKIFIKKAHFAYLLHSCIGLWTKSVNNCKLSYNSAQKRLKSHNNLRI